MSATGSTHRTLSWLPAIVIAILTIAVFAQVADHQFIHLDDGQFVFENDHVKQGLTGDSIHWAWTSVEIGYYPLTWMSHMTDVSMFGMNAGKHLLTALLLHIASSCILFFALARMTGAPVRSGFVAALFAIHPMHVESVAWVAERKDTLSVFFGMIALLLYARPRTIARDALVAFALAASLLAKQMLVTLPFVFLLLDYWPLKRRLNIVEKLPLFGLAIAGVLLAIEGQRNLNAVQSTLVLPLGDRIANALTAYVAYIAKLIWPASLAPMYPLEPANYTAAVFAFLLLVAITAAAWSMRKRAPYVLVGWLWFVGTLVPVIGIVQIGAAGMADRYTYFPSIGFFIAIVWAAADLFPRYVANIAGVVVTIILAVLALIQTSYWKDTDTLFTHTLAVTGPNPVAEYILGQTLEIDDPDRAIEHLHRSIDLTEAALRANPNSPKPEIYAQSYIGIGTALLTKANATTDANAKTTLVAEAARNYEAALLIDPRADVARRNLALAQSMMRAAAPPASPQSQVPSPKSDMDRFIDAGVALAQQHRFVEAIEQYRNAVAASPDSVEPHVYLGIGLAQAQRNADAARELRAAKRIDAARANRYVTGILRLPPSGDNLDRLIAQLTR